MPRSSRLLLSTPLLALLLSFAPGCSGPRSAPDAAWNAKDFTGDAQRPSTTAVQSMAPWLTKAEREFLLAGTYTVEIIPLGLATERAVARVQGQQVESTA